MNAVIVGAGHNGLVCGCYLAEAGFRVLVGGIAGAPGRAAAQAVLKRFKP